MVTGVWMGFPNYLVVYHIIKPQALSLRVGGDGKGEQANLILPSRLCHQPIQSVSFLRGGYVEMPPKSLSPESSLLATFATKNSSGILLVALGKDAEKAGGAQAHVVSSCKPRK